MFCISESRADEIPAYAAAEGISPSDGNLLSLFCVIDHWSADLASAMLTMGARAARAHGLPADRDRFGLLEFVRCYDPPMRESIMALFEKAASHGRPFHYSSAIETAGSGRRMVHCFGRHRTIESMASSAEIYGLFLLSHDDITEG